PDRRTSPGTRPPGLTTGRVRNAVGPGVRAGARALPRALRPVRGSLRAVPGAWPELKRALANRCRRAAGARRSLFGRSDQPDIGHPEHCGLGDGIRSPAIARTECLTLRDRRPVPGAGVLENRVEPFEKFLDFSFAPSGIRSGVDEFDFEIGADHLQVSAGKDFALIGIEFLRQAAPFKGLFNAIEQRA